MNNIKFKILFLILLFGNIYFIPAQCLPNGIYFSSQASIDNFPTNYPGCTIIEGVVTIDGYSNDITNLNGLSQIVEIQGYLYIKDTQLIDLSGLNNLQIIDEYTSITNNNNLSNLNGLENLISVNELHIQSNDNLENISAFNVSGNIYSISILDNDSLNTLWGLQNITSVEDHLYIGSNGNLTDLQPLVNINTVGSLSIQSNSQLSSLIGLQGLTTMDGRLTIENNDDLIDLQGLDNLIFASQLGISSNYSLQSLQGLQNINVTERINISSNNHLEDIQALSNISNLSNLQINNCDYLESLSGLENLIEISGNLELGSNDNLENLSGLSNLTYIGGNFRIYSMQMTDFSDLNITYVGYHININRNFHLQSLIGLENINTSDMTRLTVSANVNLSNCAIQSICEYIEIPANNVEIYNNSIGCNSRQEVEAACELSIQENPLSEVKIHPNPTNGTFKISNVKEGTLKVLDSQGRIVKHYNVSDSFYSAKDLSEGIYFVQIQSGNQTTIRQLIKN